MVAEIKKYQNQLSHFNADVLESLLPVVSGNIHTIKGLKLFLGLWRCSLCTAS